MFSTDVIIFLLQYFNPHLVEFEAMETTEMRAYYSGA
jgi:hypothetical protein